MLFHLAVLIDFRTPGGVTKMSVFRVRTLNFQYFDEMEMNHYLQEQECQLFQKYRIRSTPVD